MSKNGTFKELLFILKKDVPRKLESLFIGTIADVLSLECLEIFSSTIKAERLPMTVRWTIS
jgi:hypothetical protein